MGVLRFVIGSIFAIAILGSACNSGRRYNVSSSIDTVSEAVFLAGRSVCQFAAGKEFQEIKPQMIPWATDPEDPESESYLIDGKRLKILQPQRRSDSLSGCHRRYYYDGKEIRTTRVLRETPGFNFDEVFIDYGYSAKGIFRNGELVMLRNPPATWCGTANRFRFVQLIDLRQLTCYEFVVDYYDCLESSNSMPESL